ncbi:isocitrate lyase/PEP mutase family protein [Dactylosporangium sp. CA-139066]|uniref:isocitrate lyase/PEP mutase family protein n=1 Tax=Dactylosporangium sp. CA-139066 TaxID=3239930 RepID=UPI003D89FAC7
MDAQEFFELHQDGCFLLPNAWDAGSARMLAAAGFPALATTSAGVAFSLARADHAAAGRVPRDVMIGRVREVVEAVAGPVSADLEDGYGAAPHDVAETISLAVAAGAAGGNIEDFDGRGLYDRGLAVERVQAARAAAARPFVLVGRTDALLTGGTVAEAVARGNAYLAAGADCAFVPGAADADTIGALVAGLDGPLNVVMGLTGGALSMADLARLGVRRVTVGGSIARALYGHLRAAARELFEAGTFGYAGAQVPQDELNALFSGVRG